MDTSPQSIVGLGLPVYPVDAQVVAGHTLGRGLPRYEDCYFFVTRSSNERYTEALSWHTY